VQVFILFLFLLYPNNHYGKFSNIFSDPLEYNSKETILCKIYSRGSKPLAYTPEVSPLGLFEITLLSCHIWMKHGSSPQT
jgi:hypothetical protein